MTFEDFVAQHLDSPEVKRGYDEARARRQAMLALAEGNMEAVHADLFGGLRRVSDQNQVMMDDAAALMGISEEHVTSLLLGHVDITLSDLQELALAVGARLAFTVEANS